MINNVILGVIAGQRIYPPVPDLSNILFYGDTGSYGWFDVPSFSARSALSPAPVGGVRKGSFTDDFLLLPTTNTPFFSAYNIPGYSGVSTPASIIGELRSARGVGSTLLMTSGTSPYAQLRSLPSFSVIAWGGAAMPAACNDGAISPDGQYLAIACAGGTRLIVFRLSDWATITIAGTYPTSAANAVDWSPDSRYLAVAETNSPYLRVYDATTSFSNVTLGTSVAGSGRDVCFSRDGSKLAIGHNTSPYVSVFNTATWIKDSNPSTLPAFTVFGLAYSKNDEYLACGGDAAGAASRIVVYNVSGMTVASQPGPTTGIVQRVFFN